MSNEDSWPDGEYDEWQRSMRRWQKIVEETVNKLKERKQIIPLLYNWEQLYDNTWCFNVINDNIHVYIAFSKIKDKYNVNGDLNIRKDNKHWIELEYYRENVYFGSLEEAKQMIEGDIKFLIDKFK